MKQRLLMPEDIEVFYIIPTLKKQLAVCWKSQGKSQAEIARLLGLKSAAVSQYINNKRGNQIVFEEGLLEEIRKSSALIKDRITLFREMQRLLNTIRTSKYLCQIHRQFSDIPEHCNPKDAGCALYLR
ncbi:MAG TPA: hypothetical protein VJB08_02930 [Candidatus Nanoarchaeia archaeon]|nr:hypothetical protein [Candidatus Nanoarchaeia archaeon]